MRERGTRNSKPEVRNPNESPNPNDPSASHVILKVACDRRSWPPLRTIQFRARPTALAARRGEAGSRIGSCKMAQVTVSYRISPRGRVKTLGELTNIGEFH